MLGCPNIPQSASSVFMAIILKPQHGYKSNECTVAAPFFDFLGLKKIEPKKGKNICYIVCPLMLQIKCRLINSTQLLTFGFS